MRAGGAGDGGVEALEAELLVHEGAGFFEYSARRDDESGGGARGVGVGADVDDGEVGVR